MSKHHCTEDIYSSACVQALEQEYCSSCSAAVVSSCCVSSHGLGARIMSRIYDGGRRAVYTAAIGAMLTNNMALPAQAATVTVAAGETSTGLVVSSGTAVDRVDVYGTTSQTRVNRGGEEIVFDGGVASDTVLISGDQVISSGGVAKNTILVNGTQRIYNGGVANDAMFYNHGGGNQTIYDGGVANNTTVMGMGG